MNPDNLYVFMKCFYSTTLWTDPLADNYQAIGGIISLES